MGINDGYTNFEEVALSMGIGLDDPKWIITPETGAREIRRAFGTFSVQLISSFELVPPAPLPPPSDDDDR